MITLTDDDGAFAAQVAQAGKSRAKHRVSGDITESAFFVDFFNPVFTEAISLRIQSLGKTGRILRKASSVYFTVAALITSSGSNSLISSRVVKR